MENIDRIEVIAKVCHEANRAYCNALGDNSHKNWEEAPNWQKESARNGVKQHLLFPMTTPEETHKSWMREKEIGGWVYGAIKDLDKKTHPCMVPYNDLPWFHKLKDSLFKTIVMVLADELKNR